MVNGVLYFTAGSRRDAVAVDAGTGELLWMHRLEEGARADISSRRLSGRGVGYWTDGKGDERIFYVSIGYQLVGLDAKTGLPLKDFGVNGVVDLKKENDQQLDLVEQRRRLERRASRRAQRRHRRRGAPRRHRAAQQGEREGLHPRLRRTHRQAPVDLPHDPGSGRVRQRHLAERLVVVHRAHRCLDAADGRRGTGHRLPAGRDSDRRLLRRPPARQQPVRRKPGRAESRNGQAALALPVRAPPDLGLRRAVRADPRRHHRQRQGHQGDRAADQAGFRLRVRPRDRSAGMADRRAAGRTGQGADGMVFADAALPDQAAAIRAAGLPRERRHRLHAGAEGRGAEDRVAVQDRSAVHAADRSRRGREDRHALRPERRQLAGRLARSRHRHPLPLFALADARHVDGERSEAVGHELHQRRRRRDGGSPSRVCRW